MCDSDGGPAFPGIAGSNRHNQGMTLRDWFAGMALQGLLSNDLNDAIASAGPMPEGGIRAAYAKLAFCYSDAMLAERDKR